MRRRVIPLAPQLLKRKKTADAGSVRAGWLCGRARETMPTHACFACANGSSSTSAARRLHRANFFWKPAPGNHAGTYCKIGMCSTMNRPATSASVGPSRASWSKGTSTLSSGATSMPYIVLRMIAAKELRKHPVSCSPLIRLNWESTLTTRATREGVPAACSTGGENDVTPAE